MFTFEVIGNVVRGLDCAPWAAASGCAKRRTQQRRRALYTPEERRRRDATPWTLVQGILAPVQFVVFLVSFALVMRFLITGDGLMAANTSIVVKTLTLYTIMVTGAIWEHEVYGRYLFAPAFYWEDMVSMLVLALHTAYLGALFTHALAPEALMALALAGYATYVVNATQFVLKLRAARLQSAAESRSTTNALDHSAMSSAR